MATFEERARDILKWRHTTREDCDAAYQLQVDLARAVDDLKSRMGLLLQGRMADKVFEKPGTFVDILRAERDALQKRLDALYEAGYYWYIEDGRGPEDLIEGDDNGQYTQHIYEEMRANLVAAIEAERKAREEA